jgi:hypothetical protein
VFLAVDPVALLNPGKLLEKPRALAAYLYAISDPLNNVDADGMEPQKKGFWTRVGQSAIHLAAEAFCMSLGGCSPAVPAQPGDPIRPRLTSSEIALNLTAAHVAPRISGAIASRILKRGATANVTGETLAASASAPRFGENDLLLGLNPSGKLKAWAAKTGGKTFGEFNTPKGSFDVQIRSALDQAKAIRFNLDGIDASRANGTLNTAGEPAAGYTNYEMHLVKTNPQYLQKASFYMNGAQVKAPF